MVVRQTNLTANRTVSNEIRVIVCDTDQVIEMFRGKICPEQRWRSPGVPSLSIRQVFVEGLLGVRMCSLWGNSKKKKDT